MQLASGDRIIGLFYYLYFYYLLYQVFMSCALWFLIGSYNTYAWWLYVFVIRHHTDLPNYSYNSASHTHNTCLWFFWALVDIYVQLWTSARWWWSSPPSQIDGEKNYLNACMRLCVETSVKRTGVKVVAFVGRSCACAALHTYGTQQLVQTTLYTDIQQYWKLSNIIYVSLSNLSCTCLYTSDNRNLRW